MKDVFNPYTAIPIEITRDELRAISKVVEYLYRDESRDAWSYKGEERANHIFASVLKLDDLKRRVAHAFGLLTQVG